MQRKRKQRRPAWPMLLALLVGSGAMVYATKAQSALLAEASLSLAEIVRTDGRVRLPGSGAAGCTGWKLRLDPMLRARFVQTGASEANCRARTDAAASVYWDDQLLLPGVTGRVRAFRAGNEAVYVDSRFSFRRSGVTVSGILKWEATTGRWRVVGDPPEAKPGISAAR